MLTEDFCSFEVAKLLKEKGFDEPCYRWYDNKGDVCAKLIVPDVPPNYSLREYYLCPSQSIAMKWLRRVHNVNIDIGSIWNQKRFEYQVFVVTPENAKQCYRDDKIYLGYEEAVEAALKHCLKNLI